LRLESERHVIELSEISCIAASRRTGAETSKGIVKQSGHAESVENSRLGDISAVRLFLLATSEMNSIL
jgi:hypothetical protein